MYFLRSATRNVKEEKTTSMRRSRTAAAEEGRIREKKKKDA
jgi:hypothetical protein